MTERKYVYGKYKGKIKEGSVLQDGKFDENSPQNGWFTISTCLGESYSKGLLVTKKTREVHRGVGAAKDFPKIPKDNMEKRQR